MYVDGWVQLCVDSDTKLGRHCGKGGYVNEVFLILKKSEGKSFKVAVWSYYWCTPFLYSLGSSPETQGWMFWTIFSFLMELMVEHVSRRIQFGLMMFVISA